MNRKHLFQALIVIAIILVIIFLVFIVPIIINECYKLNKGYITVWNAEDVLNYYGTLLGAIVSVLLLAITIVYNRKQIICDKTLQKQQEKWSNIEKMVSQALDDIHPLKMEKIIADISENSRVEMLYTRLNMYELTARASVDKLLFSIDGQENENLNILVDNTSTTMQEFIKIKEEYIDHLTEALGTTHVLQMMKNGASTPELTQLCTWQFLSDFRKRSQNISKHLSRIYETEYQPLISKKKEFFNQINEKLLLNAEKMLYF